MTTELYNQYQNFDISLNYYEKLAEYCIEKLKEKNEVVIANLTERYSKMFILIVVNIFINDSKKHFDLDFEYVSKNDFFNFYSFLDLIMSNGYDNSYLSLDLAKSFCINKSYDIQSLITTIISCGVKISDIFMKKSVALIKAKGFESEYEKSDLKKHEEKFDTDMYNEDFLNYLFENENQELQKENITNFYECADKQDQAWLKIRIKSKTINLMLNEIHETENKFVIDFFNSFMINFRNERMKFLEYNFFRQYHNIDIINKFNFTQYVNNYYLNIYEYLDFVMILGFKNTVRKLDLLPSGDFETNSCDPEKYGQLAANTFNRINDLLREIRGLHFDIIETAIMRSHGIKIVPTIFT